MRVVWTGTPPTRLLIFSGIGATETSARSGGDIVSSYCNPSPCQEDTFNPTVIANLHGFLRGGVYASIGFPAALATASFGINDGDDIVGAYEDASGAIHGYLRTP